MTTVKHTKSDKESFTEINKAENSLPSPRLWAITAILGMAIFNIACTGESADEAPPVAQEAPTPVKEVCLYEHKDYKGWEKCYTSDEAKFVPLGINDQVSSLKIKGGATAELFQHHDYAGFKREYTQDTAWVGADNDQFSSLKIK